MTKKIAIKKADITDRNLTYTLITLCSGYIDSASTEAIVFLVDDKRDKMVKLLKECDIPYKVINIRSMARR